MANNIEYNDDNSSLITIEFRVKRVDGNEKLQKEYEDIATLLHQSGALMLKENRLESFCTIVEKESEIPKPMLSLVK